ncbi:hematopoietic progenitor cell antigen CD34 isoform X1 [Phyllostomus discolor]|uniref:Hematopoietic progenitor cell antigen CD34 isoform X1 n=1 Tax=Phyllostomus discolor TaxID=89673 RepID=A0A6J2N9Z8_9CHIR|nr:hematopoietic progenitor cell antigen CD34 isoform X1 [Phyllostomus discolor]
MLGRRSARAERGMPRGWTALCLLSLLPSGFTATNNLTIATESPTTKILSAVPTNVSRNNQETVTPSTLENTTLYIVPQNSSGTTAAISETTVNFTSTSGTTPVLTTMNSSVQAQTSSVTTVSSTPANLSTSAMTLEPSTSPGNISDSLNSSTSPVTFTTKPYTSFSTTQSTIKKEIKCSGVKEVKLTQAICLELNETSSCEDFKKENGEELIQVLCGKDQAEAGDKACSLLLAQSEVRPHCLLLVLANKTELFSKLQLLKNHQSDLKKLGIQGFTEQNVGSHQSHSRKTLIALVTSGILLAVLGTTGYFLMNRRSWSPTGERLGEDPYYTENGGGQGYSSGPGASPEAQGKASVNRGAQENGTGQATSRNGHSARQHMVADTEL